MSGKKAANATRRQNSGVAQLLQGYDSFIDETRSTALIGTVVDKGTTTTIFYKVCYNLKSLQEALQIDASVSASYGIYSADAKAEFIRKLDITTYTVSIVVYCQRALTEVIVNPNINVIADPSLNAFFQKYGDSWISQISTGGAYYATYAFYAESKKEQDDLKATFSAGGISTGGSLTVDLQTNLTKIYQSSTTRVSFQQNMEGFAHLPYPESTQIIEFALKFTSLDPDSPVVISYQKTGYESLVPNFQQIVLNRQLVEGLGTQPGLAHKLVLLDTLQNQIGWLKQVYQTYNNYTGDSQLIQNLAQVNTDYAALISFISNKIDSDPTQDYSDSIPPLPSVLYSTPQLNYQWAYSNAWGGKGVAFSDIQPKWIPLQVTLDSLLCRGGSWIDQIQFMYTLPDGSQLTFTHGGNGGVSNNPLVLSPGEFISSISGSYGDYINQLTFTTNKGQKYTSPSGPGPNSFNWAVPDGGVVTFFQGGSGYYLDQLQVCVLQLQPAIWSQLTDDQVLLLGGQPDERVVCFQ
jgi:hypothetical protein